MFYQLSKLDNMWFKCLKSVVLLCSVTVLGSLSSCEKFLEMPVRDKVLQESMFTDEQGFMDALTGVYLAMDKPASSGGMGLYTHDLSMGMLSVMANDYSNAATSALGDGLYANSFRYDYEQNRVKQEIRFIWSGLYNNIANLNNLLAYIDQKEDVFSRDHYHRVKGEAIALRALFHFDLARMFGQSPVTGMDERAIPYVRVFSAESTPFVSLQSALDSCISDLNSAKAILAQTDTTALSEGSLVLFSGYTQNHMNYWATKALLARVHLYRGNYNLALKEALEVIGSNKFPLSTSNVAVASANVRDRLFSKELLFSLYSTNTVTNSDGLFNMSAGNPLMLALANKNALYGTVAPLDWRLSWFDNNARNINVPSKYFQNSNLPYTMQNIVPLLRITEMYYIVAECKNNMGDLEEGLGYLNAVRMARGLNPLTLSAVPDNVALSNAITLEYKKEFIYEGQTFFYYKRLNKDLKVESGTTAVVPNNAYVFPIPDKEGEYNP